MFVSTKYIWDWEGGGIVGGDCVAPKIPFLDMLQFYWWHLRVKYFNPVGFLPPWG